jgi:TPR repeat protein
VDKAKIERGMTLLKEAADAGHVTAQFNYALAHSSQQPYVDKDCETARRYYRSASDAGHPAAMINLAHELKWDCGAETADEEAGFRLLADAAAAGAPMAFWELGIRYVLGEGTAPDVETGKTLMSQARAAGVRDSVPSAVAAVLGAGWEP